MKRISKFKFIYYILALLLLVEPTLLPVINASDMPKPKLNTDKVDGIVPIDELVAPSDYLDYMLRLRGRTKAEAENKSWGDWMSTLTSAYMQMDDGAADVFSFYSALSILKDNRTIFTDTTDTIKILMKQSTMFFAFVGKTNMAARAGNMIKGFLNLGKITEKAQKFINNNKVLKFMEFAAPPPCWNDPKIAGEGFKSYWRWVRKKTFNKTGKGLGSGKYISDSKGYARSLGIGLTLFGLAVDSYGVYSSDDRKGGRFGSYSLVKNYAGITLSLATLAGMFLTPGLGQAAMIATGIWLMLVTIGDMLGSYNKKWKAAYKNSYWYLYENDPEFKSFYNNKSYLGVEEKSAALIITEKNYGSSIANMPTPKNDNEKAIQDRTKRVYTSLEKQGVLVSYYSQKGFSLPDFSIDRLEELWKMKADFMSWKPTEKETNEQKHTGFWGKVGHYVNPLTYVAWAGDKIKSSDYKNTVKEYNVKKVFFNPDYVLIKKYQNYITANKLRGGIYDVVGLRMEQSPFNYVPLLEIDSANWSKELITQSFEADSFLVGVKELMYFREQIKLAKDKAEEFVDTLDDKMERISEKDIPHSKRIQEALDSIIEAYSDNPDEENNELKDLCGDTFGWKWNKKFGKCTPANILKVYKTDIEQALECEPLAIAQKAAETVILQATIKQKLDTAMMMNALIDEKQKAYDNCDKTFPNEAFRRFIKKGEFLGTNKGFMSKAMSWLGNDYSAYDEFDKYLKLIRDDVKDYTGAANASVSDTRSVMWLFHKTVMTPGEMLEKLNESLESYREILEKYSDLADKTGVKVEFDENEDFKNKVFVEYKLGYEVKALDVDNPVSNINPE